MKKRIAILLALAMFITVVMPCCPYEAADPSLSSSLFTTKAEAATIKLNLTGTVIPAGMYKKLSVSGTTKKVSWSSSNKTIAAVSSSGVVTARKTGTAIITAKVTGKTLRCRVTVINRYNALQVGNAALRIIRKYYPKAYLQEHERKGSRVILWIGRPYGDEVPGIEVTVNINTGRASCDPEWDIYFPGVPRYFTVWNCRTRVKVSKLTLNRTTATIVKGKTITLKATASPSTATNKAVSWKSSNTKVATVTSAGTVKGISNGTATITATAKDGSGKKAACKVTVVTSAPRVLHVTDTVRKMTAVQAAKYLGLPVIQRSDGYLYYSKKKGNVNTMTMLETTSDLKNYSACWDLTVCENIISVYGIRTSMTLSKALSVVNKNKYMKVFHEADVSTITKNKQGELECYYYNESRGVYVYITLTIRNGSVRKIYMGGGLD